jgi:hypothetical protein
MAGPQLFDPVSQDYAAVRGFAARGLDILGLEPAHAMAQEARQALRDFANVRIEECTFEDWQPSPARFALLYAAQAYHWVDPEIGLAKPGTVLAEGGHVALFWNVKRASTSPLRSALDHAYAEHAPVLAQRVGGGAEAAVASVVSRFDASRLYERAAQERLPWATSYSTRDYLRLLGTFSDHITLPRSQREPLFAAIAAAIEAEGGMLHMEYETQCFVFRRR